MQQQSDSTNWPTPLATLDTVLNKVRGFAFEPTLVSQADKLLRDAHHQKESCDKYRAISLAIEIYNEYGFSNRSKVAFHQFEPEVENILAQISPATFADRSQKEIEEDKKKWEQICWVYAGAAITHYWNNESQEGLKRIQRANYVIEKYLITEHKGEKRYCSGIRARLAYYEALLYLQLNDPNNAEKALKNSLVFAKQRINIVAKTHEEQEDYWTTPGGLRESHYTVICVAKLQAFVKARIQLLRGELKESEFLLESSEAVLRQSQSPLMVQMIQLWLYKVKRALAGRDLEQLDLIIMKLDECYAVFSAQEKGEEPAQNKQYYASFAAFELSLAYLYKAQGLRHLILAGKEKESDEVKQKLLAESNEYHEALRQARFYLAEVGNQASSNESASEDLKDYWEFSKALLESRIDRETDPQRAEVNAKRALSIAEGMIRRPDLVADAYIAIGEALIKLKKPAEALNKFMDAERENDKDEDKRLAKIKAVCCLRKAEAYVALNRKYDALIMLDEWKLLESQVEPEVIKFIARKVELQVEDVKGDFIISKDCDDLNLGLHSKKLEEWLTVLVIKRHKKSEAEKPNPKWLDKPNPKWLEEDMKISLSKAYKLLNDRDPTWKDKKSSSTSASLGSSTDESTSGNTKS